MQFRRPWFETAGREVGNFILPPFRIEELLLSSLIFMICVTKFLVFLRLLAYGIIRS